jgi:predicted nucleic acid-binding Zn ribbon protein
MDTPEPDRTCPYCKNEYTPNTYWQRFCSKTCQQDHHRDRRKAADKLLKESEQNERYSDRK